MESELDEDAHERVAESEMTRRKIRGTLKLKAIKTKVKWIVRIKEEEVEDY